MSNAEPGRGAASHSAQGTNLVIWVLWLTYGSFYFCRTNIAAALPGIEAELGYSKATMGIVLGSLKLAYGIGQLINGQLAERFRPRKLLAIGMLASAALNVVFGWMTALYFFLFVWACNGYSQSLGWTPCMRVAANWLPARVRGIKIGIIGTGYQVTAALTFVVSGYAAEAWGWRYAFWVPAGLLVLSAVHMLFFLEEAPAGKDPLPARNHTAKQQLPFRKTIAVTLSNPALWFLALGLGLLNANRYGFLDWGISHLKEVQGTGVGTAGAKYMFLPIGGVLGALVSGWATDRWFGGRRAPVMCLLLAGLGVLTLVYNSAVHEGRGAAVLILICVGFCIYGAQVLLVGTAPVDLARASAPAAAVGFVDAMGYAGAFAGDLVTGTLVDRFGWRAGIGFWAFCAFAAAGLLAVLWKVSKPDEDEAT